MTYAFFEQRDATEKNEFPHENFCARQDVTGKREIEEKTSASFFPECVRDELKTFSATPDSRVAKGLDTFPDYTRFTYTHPNLCSKI